MSHHLLTIPAPSCGFITLNGGHGNRYALAAKVRTWREAAAWEARRTQQPKLTGLVHITATVHRDHNRGQWDVSNWLPSAKAAIDGLRDAGVLVEDSNRFVIGPDMRAGDAWADAALVLRIERIEAAA